MDKRHNFYLELESSMYGAECLVLLLDKRTLQILRAYFGEGNTLEAIGTGVSLTKERVRQIKEKGLRVIWKAFGVYKEREEELQKLRKENGLLCGRIRNLEILLEGYRLEYIEQIEYEWSKFPIASLDMKVRTLNRLDALGFKHALLSDLVPKIIQESKRSRHGASRWFLRGRNFGQKSLTDLIKGLELAGVPEYVIDFLR